ncbi:hypothetical protein M0813_28908 [Anaeramoeba flamelloides]|uniref:Nucleolar protein 10 n=1 Tax=Anaeramoeba flamelloides TaxID=1746091 RepID=A0ABQ8XQW1_9EUKA|nr:hypothetical protein M0813_28908 [Anaeramoeba flamelloides]
MSIQLVSSTGLKIYDVTAGKRLPDWVKRHKKLRDLKKDKSFRQRIELVQDFEFPVSCQRIKFTNDGQHLIASGVYLPQIKVWDLNELSMKFERHIDSEVIDFCCLTDDWSKIAFIERDRNIEFHSRGGMYYKIRTPKIARTLQYHYPSCDLFLAGSSSDIWRLNLEEGRFLNTIETNYDAINCLSFNPYHQLLVAGCEEGGVVCIDPRTKKQLSSLNINKENESLDVTSIAQHPNGLEIAIGDSNGKIHLYDLRSSKPKLVKDHQYENSIKQIKYQNSERIFSCDKKLLKVWNSNTGETLANLETEQEINSFDIYKSTGLFCLATDDSRIKAYYAPSIGIAPNWCSFLDSLTEELEETDTTVIYDDYKFVTRQELSKLGLSHLIGTNLLKSYMHGYFIKVKLYSKAKSIAQPFLLEEMRQKQIKNTIDDQQRPRIEKKTTKNPLGVNKNVVSYQKTDQESLGKVMKDKRFERMWRDPKMKLHSGHEKFISKKPFQLDKKTLPDFEELSDELDLFENIDDDDDDEDEDYDDYSNDNDDNNDDEGGYSSPGDEMERKNRMMKKKKKNYGKEKVIVEEVDLEKEEQEMKEKEQKEKLRKREERLKKLQNRKKKKPKKKKQNKKRLFEIKDDKNEKGFGLFNNKNLKDAQKKRRIEKYVTLGTRINTDKSKPITQTRTVLSGREMSFVPNSVKNKNKNRNENKNRKRSKRSKKY